MSTPPTRSVRLLPTHASTVFPAGSPAARRASLRGPRRLAPKFRARCPASIAVYRPGLA
jgi:hypothetical protein